MSAASSKIGRNTAKPPNAGKGRPKGARNKTTVAIKEAIQHVYAGLQAKTGKEHGHFLDWAEENPTEFYKIAAKLIPLDVNANISGNIGMPEINLGVSDD